MTSLQQNEIISIIQKYGPIDTEAISLRLEISPDTTRTQCYRLRKKGFIQRDGDKQWFIVRDVGLDCSEDVADTSIIQMVENAFDPFTNLSLADEDGVVGVQWPDHVIEEESVLLGQPIDMIRHLQEVYRDKYHLDSTPFFSFQGIPMMGIGGLGVDDIDRMVCVEGDIVGHEQPSAVPFKCRVVCLACEGVFVSRLEKGVARPVHNTCPKSGCNGKTRMIPNTFISRTEQWFVIEETGAYDQASKSFLRVCLPRELIDFCGDPRERVVRDGNTIRVSGVYKCYVTKEKGGFSSNLYLDASCLELVQSDIVSIEVSDSDMTRLKEFHEAPNVGERLVSCVAPNIFSMGLAKKAMLLSSVYAMKEPGEKRRNFNLLFVGHVGIAKTQLARWWCNFYPRSTFSSGVGSSAVGLFGMAQRQEKKDGGRFTILAGSIPRASGGIAVVDEVEKQIDAYGEGQFLEALEDRSVSIQKGDARASLPADCPVWLLANWRDMLPPDEFSPRVASLPKQISNALRNRCIILDMDYIASDVDMDKVSWTMLARFGEVPLQSVAEPPLGVDDFMRYLAVARGFSPRIPLAVAQEIHRLFRVWRDKARVQRSGVRGGVFDLTARLQDDFSIAVCASAMLHWRDVATMEDVEFVLPVFTHVVERWAMDGDRIDPGLLCVGLSGEELRGRSEVLATLRSIGGMDAEALASHVSQVLEEPRLLSRMVDEGVVVEHEGVFMVPEGVERSA